MKHCVSTKVLLLTLILCVCFAANAENAMPRKLAFYAVPRTSCDSEGQGKLASSCWEQAPASTTYYEYWKTNPALSPLKSELKMLYNERGLYVKIINVDDNIQKLRTAIVRRDDPRLWTDDCAEIYIDPQANGVGYRVFTLNSEAIQGDRMQMDAAVSDDDWSGYGWRVFTDKDRNSWTAEVFFPWTDLGQTAREGDIWMFNHVRYAWSSGKFVGSSWSAGGSYQSPGNFGFIYFEGDEKLSPQLVGKVLSPVAPAPWLLSTPEGILLHPSPDKMELTNASRLAETQLAALRRSQKRAIEAARGDQAAMKKLKEYEAEVNSIAGQSETPGLAAVEEMANLQEKMDAIYWQSKLSALIIRSTQS